MKRGDLLVLPNRWRINVTREGKVVKLLYKEYFRRGDISKEEWKAIIENTKRTAEVIAKQFGYELAFNESEDELYIDIKIESTLEEIATIITSEFLPMSKMGNLTLNRLWQFAAVGASLVASKGKLELKIGGE